MFNPAKTPMSLLQPGDRVTFQSRMTILVQSPGMFTTVQDLGRPGHGVDGVSRAGAADPLALRIGNRLLGNRDNAPALEMTLLGGTFLFPDGAQIVLTGGRSASLPATKSSTPNPAKRSASARWKPAPAATVRQGRNRAPLVAGSASTHALSGLGGQP